MAQKQYVAMAKTTIKVKNVHVYVLEMLGLS